MNVSICVCMKFGVIAYASHQLSNRMLLPLPGATHRHFPVASTHHGAVLRIKRKRSFVAVRAAAGPEAEGDVGQRQRAETQVEEGEGFEEKAQAKGEEYCCPRKVNGKERSVALISSCGAEPRACKRPRRSCEWP